MIQFTEEEISQLPYELPADDEIVGILNEMKIDISKDISNATLVYGGDGDPCSGNCTSAGGSPGDGGCCWS